MSGRSSRSTLMLTKLSFMTLAIAGSSNDSWAITWHQWQAEYPTDSRIGLPVLRACASASSPHGYQSTRLSACCCRYGLVSLARRLGMSQEVMRAKGFGNADERRCSADERTPEWVMYISRHVIIGWILPMTLSF